MNAGPVSVVMTADPITVSVQTPFKDIAQLLTGNGISAVGVLDKTGALVGVVSEADLLPHLWDRKPRWRDRRLARKATACVAKDLMTSPAVTIDAGATLAEAAATFAHSGVRRLFVLRGGKVAGVLSRRDLVSVFTRGDADLEREVSDRVLREQLNLGPDRVRVEVRAGIVTVVGRVERRSDIDPVTRLIQELSGVVEVRNRLDYVWNDVA
ncbi:CBS domain-containing protein [Amycolatopsis sp. FBCC-B4732]|uniref:CBS domain-containing protein n=1 Tax=Amycolatopsis sp. FBCC-B4732 TaxID=3079339 RepID=UPI001FF15D8D|nr:CBS domain-containing protein [Amycolatopsis sp. FBCC-B4732]UOX90613.1 CBS domain-containing protein [Amycolatopsis sp. FBCC-B4732]